MQPKRHSEIIDSLFTYRKVEQLEEYIENNPQLNIITLTDTQGNNVLHQLAFEGHHQLIKVFVRKVIIKLKRKHQSQPSHKKDLEQKEFKQWINQKNNQGFTPLLYASYSGHLQIIRCLVEQYTADINIKTNTGLNPLHLAAQKNMLMPFLYFRNRIDLYAFDDLKSTPLHWASYTNSEEVVAYILADTQNIQYLNLKDTENNTPLSLAVSYGNTRVVRRLLIKGADRYIKNSDGKSPLQIAMESEFKTITKMLNQKFSILDNVKFYCNIKIQYRPKRRKYTIPLLFLCSFILNLSILNIFLTITEDYALYTEVAFMTILLAFYLSLLNSPTSYPKDMQLLLQQYNERTIKKICFICKHKIPKRGYHCDTCGVCIEQYDHHCTWINNCVGKRNIARFIFFIVMLVLSLAFIGVISIMATIAIAADDPWKFSTYFSFRYLPNSNLEKYCLIGCFVVNEATSIFVGPVLMLVIVQIRNLLTNKTTFEKMKGPKEDSQEIKSKMSKQRKVSLRNCQVMCSNTRGSFTTTRSSFAQLITEAFPSEKLDLVQHTTE